MKFSDTINDESSSSVALDEKMEDVEIVENKVFVCIIDVWMWLDEKVSVKINEKSVAK